jgi:hypothetical protein
MSAASHQNILLTRLESIADILFTSPVVGFQSG